MSSKKNKHCLMLFYTGEDLGYTEPDTIDEYFNTANFFFENGTDALNAYADTPCPASQLVSGETDEKLLKEINKMKKNFKNKKWLEKNIYPYI